MVRHNGPAGESGGLFFRIPLFCRTFARPVRQAVPGKTLMKILIMNGPNLNLLGTREPGIYGTGTMDECLSGLRRRYADLEIDYYQNNVEGLLIDRLQAAMTDGTAGVVLNAGAYTHTSVALHDAIRAMRIPVIETHISNVHTREEFRHRSVIAPACRGVICGFGLDSYRLAVEALRAIAGE